jgi:hypothetical protein
MGALRLTGSVRSGQSRRLDVCKPSNAAAETSWRVKMSPAYT